MPRAFDNFCSEQKLNSANETPPQDESNKSKSYRDFDVSTLMNLFRGVCLKHELGFLGLIYLELLIKLLPSMRSQREPSDIFSR